MTLSKNIVLCKIIKLVKKSIKKCEHGKHKARCKDCGGSGICDILYLKYVKKVTASNNFLN